MRRSRCVSLVCLRTAASVVSAAVFAALLAMGFLAGTTTELLRAEEPSLKSAFAALREPVAAGKFRSPLRALDDLESRLKAERITSVHQALPKSPPGWKITSDEWNCLEGVQGARTWEGSGDRRLVLRLEEHSPGKEIVDVTMNLLDPRRAEKNGEKVLTVGHHKVLLRFDSYEGGSHGVVRWALPEADRDRMHGGLSLLTLEATGLSKVDLLAQASTVDAAAIQARLDERFPDSAGAKMPAPLLLSEAAAAHAKGALGQALAHVRLLKRQLASNRARHLADVLPKEAPGWRYDSGGLGGWPAGVSKSFRQGPRLKVYVGVTEGKPKEARTVRTKLADPSKLAVGESIGRLGGRAALLHHDTKESTWLLRVCIDDDAAVAWVRTWDAEDRAPLELFAKLVDLPALERALRR